MSRTAAYIYILFSSLVCFSLQFNLPAIFSFLHPHWSVIRLVPYFFLGCALAPLLLWWLQRRGSIALLPWLPPAVLLFGLFVVFRSPSTALCAVFVLLVFSSV